MKKLAPTALLLIVALSASDAHACGEVMYRMGGALRYHAFVTKHPAQILMYANAASNVADDAESREQFHRDLEKAGHTVTVVDSPDALAQCTARSRISH